MNFLDFTWGVHDWIGTASYMILAGSYLVTNMIWLRVLAAIALSAEALYLYFGGDKPLWIGVVWSGVFVVINVIQLGLIYRERLMSRLTQEENSLRTWLFPSLNDVDFHHLLKAGVRCEIGSGTFLASQGEKLDHLYVITQGIALVVAHGQVVATLREGNMVGEVSFFRDDVATASVVAQGSVRVLQVSRTELRKLMQERESLNRALHESISRDLGFKLTAF